MILTATPFRVSLFGGGTDYPAWFAEHGGATLGMAIDKYCYVGVKPMPPGQTMRFRVQYSKVNDCHSVDEIEHPAVRGALRHLGLDAALEFHVFGDMPGRAGLGGSSALTVGILHAHRPLFPHLGGAESLDPWALAEEATFVEQSVIGEAVGCQDQVFAAHGGLRLVEFRADGISLRSLELRAERLEELQASLVLVYSGAMRDAHAMAARQIAEIPAKGAVLGRMAEMAREGADLLASPRPLLEIGYLLREAWALKRELCADVATPGVDAIYTRGLACGAVGGKLLGAGGGGFLLFYVPLARRREFEAKIGAPHCGFRVSPRGTRVVIDERG